ncbi:MAG: hypothetical protein U5K55_11415 [Aliarcobacter sp.]|nr:hypothetical protein [Aliarcobacter sp.]
MNSNSKIPNAIEHLNIIKNKLEKRESFTFIRFSDGETEILKKNRYLEIIPGKTVFRGKEIKNNFPQFDSKKFDPLEHQNIREDLLESARFKAHNYFKGIPTLHNKAVDDRDMMVELNDGLDNSITFADLFLNSNYEKYLDEIVPIFETYENIIVIANYRAKPIDILKKAKHIEIPDNFFANYNNVLEDVLDKLKDISKNSLILSSASSLSNIIGYKLFLQRKDITFLDIGTSINSLLSLDDRIRSLS